MQAWSDLLKLVAGMSRAIRGRANPRSLEASTKRLEFLAAITLIAQLMLTESIGRVIGTKMELKTLA